MHRAPRGLRSCRWRREPCAPGLRPSKQSPTPPWSRTTPNPSWDGPREPLGMPSVDSRARGLRTLLTGRRDPSPPRPGGSTPHCPTVLAGGRDLTRDCLTPGPLSQPSLSRRRWSGQPVTCSLVTRALRVVLVCATENVPVRPKHKGRSPERPVHCGQEGPRGSSSEVSPPHASDLSTPGKAVPTGSTGPSPPPTWLEDRGRDSSHCRPRGMDARRRPVSSSCRSHLASPSPVLPLRQTGPWLDPVPRVLSPGYRRLPHQVEHLRPLPLASDLTGRNPI